MPSPTFLISLNESFLRDYPQLIEQSRQLAQTYQAKTAAIEDGALESVGASLWQSLSCDADFTHQEQASGQDALNIIIESSEPKVLNLAWETLYHPEFGFLGRSARFTLSRRLPMQAAPTLPDVDCTPLRILLFSAMPMDLGGHGRLRIEEEKANILQAVTPLEDQGLVQLITPDDGRVDSFKHALQTHQPHLVYLSGHGSLHHNTIENTYQGQFLFEDNHANSLSVSEDELVECFNNTQVQAIVLSACESGKFDARDLNNGLSIRLAQKGIPHVIGMRESILDAAGLEFAVTFLQQIAQKQSVATALQQARAAIKTHIAGYVSREQQSNPILSAITKQQWCLPSLISHDIAQPLVDWSFTPQPKDYTISFNNSLDTISLPEQFLGRKRELYKLAQPLLNGSQKQLLLTAAGGMGKTALAGKLCQQLTQAGFEIFAYSAREGNHWSNFVSDLEFALEAHHATQYDARKARMTDTQKAQTLLKYLLAQHQGKVVLFLDNLESIQDPQSRALTDDEIQFWLTTAQTLTAQGLRIILTSRWCLPDWAGGTHHDLEKPAYSDFIAFARQKGLLTTLTKQQKSREVYDILGGNFRAFEFFVNASLHMNLAQTDNFLAALSQAKDESQTDMALEKVLSQRSELEKSLLTRLLAYPTAVPMKGISVIAVKVNPPLSETGEHADAIENLANVSLVERIDNTECGGTDYQTAPLVKDYLLQQGQQVNLDTLKVAALYLYEDLLALRPRLTLALLIHKTLKGAEEIETAQQLLLNTITGNLNQAGLYHSLLNDYLLPSLDHTHPAKTLAETQGQIGKQYYHIGNYETALNYLKQSLAITQEIGNKSGEGRTLSNISLIYSARGDYETALNYLKQSLAITQEIGNKSGEGRTLSNISLIYSARGDYETALNYLKQSLAIQQEIGDKSGEGPTLNNISLIYDARGDYETALNYLKQSLAITQEIGDKSGEGTTLNNISQIFKARGDYETALNYLKQSLAITQEIGDKSGEGTTLNNISQIFKARGDYETALNYLKQSLAITQEIGDKSGEGRTLNNISQIFQARGDYETALNYLKQSLAIQQEIGNKSGEGRTLNNISQIFQARGDYETALNYLKQSLAIQQEIGDKSGEGTTLNNMATTAHARGDYETALNYLKQSLAIQQEIGDKSGEGTTLNNISQIFKARGDYETALNYLKQSLAIQQEIGDKSGEGTTLNNISQIYDARGDYETALNYLKQSLAIQQEIGDKSGECATLFNIGHIHMQNEEIQEAVSAWVTVYTVAKNMGESQALEALESLAPQIGLEGGLAGWEALAKKFTA